jgi:hypothetical protein
MHIAVERERLRSPLTKAVFTLLDAARIPASVTYRILRLLADAQDAGPHDHVLFEIPGKPVSGNMRVTYAERRPGDEEGSLRKRVLTAEATQYANRVRNIAEGEAALRRWTIPQYVAVDIEGYNVNFDRDNLAKTVNDPLQRVLYADDRRILDGSITRFEDDGGPRVLVTVRKIAGGDYGFKAARKGTGDRVKRATRGMPAHVLAAIERGQRAR